jgi:peptide/nickel transport system permease protein
VSARYVLRRLVEALLAVAGILLLTFVLVQAAPGDPVHALGADGGDPEYQDYLRSLLHLDRPLHDQVTTYTGNVLRGRLGDSFIQGRPVTEVIGERLWPTVLLMGTTLVLSSLIGTALGVLAARRPYGRFDLTVNSGALICYAVPAFWLGQIAILTVALRTGWFPLQGLTDPRAQYTGWTHVADVAHHLVLPALVLAASEVALITRVTRTGLIQELGKDYVRAARARGAGERSVVFGQALPNALLPLVTIIGARLGALFSGAVVIETVFSWPGLGSLIVSSSQTRDRPVLLGLVLLVGFSVVVANLVTDLLYGWIDPRIRFE